MRKTTVLRIYPLFPAYNTDHFYSRLFCRTICPKGCDTVMYITREYLFIGEPICRSSITGQSGNFFKEFPVIGTLNLKIRDICMIYSPHHSCAVLLAVNPEITKAGGCRALRVRRVNISSHRRSGYS